MSRRLFKIRNPICARCQKSRMRRTEWWYRAARLTFLVLGIVMVPALATDRFPAWLEALPFFVQQILVGAFILAVIVIGLGVTFMSQSYICPKCGHALFTPAEPLSIGWKLLIWFGIVSLVIFLGLLGILLWSGT